jgi:hypothetical protein
MVVGTVSLLALGSIDRLFEHGIVPSGYIKARKVVDQPSNY